MIWNDGAFGFLEEVARNKKSKMSSDMTSVYDLKFPQHTLTSVILICWLHWNGKLWTCILAECIFVWYTFFIVSCGCLICETNKPFTLSFVSLCFVTAYEKDKTVWKSSALTSFYLWHFTIFHAFFYVCTSCTTLIMIIIIIIIYLVLCNVVTDMMLLFHAE